MTDVVIPVGTYGEFAQGCVVIPKETYEYLLKRDSLLSQIKELLVDDIALIDAVAKIDTGV